MVMEGQKVQSSNKRDQNKINVQIDVDVNPQFSLAYEFDDPEFAGTKLRNAGLWENGCWPKKAAKTDAGLAVLSLDEW